MSAPQREVRPAVLLARHGQTLANAAGVVLGCGDSPLTTGGRAACARLAARLAPAGTGVVCTSPLGRARATAEVFAAVLAWGMKTVDGLRELSCGDWEGLPRTAVLPQGGALRRDWADAPPGGESCAAAEERVRAAAAFVASPAYDNVLVVGHAGVNQVLLGVLLGLSPAEALAVRHPHDVVYTVRDGAVSWLDARGATGRGLLT